METPARRQYLDLKARHPDAILWFRMGDFYETFDGDAEVMARDLHITLTSREFGRGNRVPMAGVPHHAATSYLRRLLAKGHRVAICEQLTEAGRGLVERDVVRVITPGTVVEPNLLAARENNYLAALLPAREGVGLAYVDVTTGEFAVCQFGAEDSTALAAELTRIDPSEILIPEGREERVFDVLPRGGVSAERTPLTPCPPRWFHEPPARERLLNHFGAVSLEPYGCDGLRLAIGAAGATLAYVEAADRNVARLLRALRTDRPGAQMTLDLYTRRNLDLTRTARSGNRTGTLIHVLDQTQTPMGGRLLRRWLSAPQLDLPELHRRQDVVDAFLHDAALRGRVQALLSDAGDLERAAARARQGTATARDLVGLAAGLCAAQSIGAAIAGVTAEDAGRVIDGTPSHPRQTALRNLAAALDPITDIAALVERSIAIEGERRIKPGFDDELDRILAVVAGAQETMVALERRLRERTGIRSLKVGYNKVFGYYIEVSRARANLDGIPADFIRRQTLANAERYATEELQVCEAAILRAEERVADLEGRVFAEVRDTAGAAVGRLLATAAALADLDVLAAFARVASERRYVRPLLDESGALSIEGGRHPVVEAALEDGAFIANDCHLAMEGISTFDWSTTREQEPLNDGEVGRPSPGACRIMLITGPNMAGKSTYLRQVALIVLMAQVGSFVPATAARIGLVDRIFTRVGAHDDLAAGASTFLVEMVETAAILRAATSRSLLIFDEIGRGTSTFDGLSIAQAVVEDVHDRIGARTLFATHYHEMTALAERLPGLRNANAAAVEEGGRVVFLHRIRPGGADRSYGIHVAGIAGLPEHVTERARGILAGLEGERAAQYALPSTSRRAGPSPDGRSEGGSATDAAHHPPLSQPLSEGARERNKPGNGPLRDLLDIDLARTTPLEALNLLAQLQDAARADGTQSPPLRLVSEQWHERHAP